EQRIAQLRDKMFAQGRLLEQRLFEYYCGRGSVESCFRALLAYQNDDGGFGAGIEPDLMTPESTAIGAETALYYCDLLGWRQEAILRQVASWVRRVLSDGSVIPHPPQNMSLYPHQPWWNSPDEGRVLSVTGLLRLLGAEDAALFDRVNRLAEAVVLPDHLKFYDYPPLLYAIYTPEFSRRDEIIGHYAERLPRILEENSDHYPLFSRYWYHAQPLVDPALLARERAKTISAFGETGALPSPYPTLPWWEAIFSLDALMILSMTE
ncbi:MAG TPA: hypothetical protein VK905_06100, partial [Bacillota bacterium]|nr:hypothetical protein [Bacillota bacterium]